MRIEVDETFRAEVERFGLRYRCADCLLFVAADGCAHFWPNADHERDAAREPGAEVVFCKEFELR